MTALGVFFLVAGFVVAIAGAIWLLVVGFQEGVMWGLGMLCPGINGIVSLIFVISHWQDAKKPFLLQLSGLAPVFLGLMLVGSGGPSTPPPPEDNVFSSSSRDAGGRDSGTSDFFTQPTATPLPFRPTPTVLNRSPIPTRTPIPPTSTPLPTATPLAAQLAAENVGRVLELYLTDGRSVKITLTGTDEENLIVTRRIGGGAISYAIRRDSVKGFKVIR